VKLQELINDIADALLAIDSSSVPFKSYQPGVGPYGEPQLLTEVARRLDALPSYGGARTKRTPDLLIPGQWALEFKIARPFGNNDKAAENWSVNLLHPYPGNVSSIGDCFKLQALQSEERKAIVVIGYEHDPPRTDLTPLILSFEAIAQHVMQFALEARVEEQRRNLIHPVHQRVTVFAWEVLDKVDRQTSADER
jgi:hypothetical protein